MFQVLLLKPALIYIHFAGLGSTNKSAISLLLSLYLILVLSSPPSFVLPQTLWQIWQKLSSLSSCSIRLQWVPGYSFLSKVRRSLTLTVSPFHDLVLWKTALFLFLFAKAALAYLPTALSVALRPLFPFQQAQFVQVSLLKPVPFCKFFAGLGSTIKSVISLLLLSDSRSVLSSIFPSTINSVADLAGTVFSLLLFFQTTMGPRTLVSPGERSS